MKYTLLLCVLLVLALTLTTTASTDAFKARFLELMTADQATIAASPELSDLKADVCKFPLVDLSSLKGKSVDLFDAFRDNYEYKFVFCADVSSEKECASNHGALCQYDRNDNNKFVAALCSWTQSPAPVVTQTKPDDKSSGYTLSFENGGLCDGARKRYLTMNLQCPTKNAVATISEEQTCVYNVSIPTKLACPGGSDDDELSGGAIFLLVVFLTLAIYFIAGFAICFFRFGKTGVDAVPHFTAFWSQLPKWYMAGISFTIGKVKNLGGSRTITTSSGEYDQA